MMKSAAVSELKARLSEYLSQVKAGMEVLITDRGKPVARLVPVSRTKDLKQSMVRTEKQGLIRLGPLTHPRMMKMFLILDQTPSCARWHVILSK